MGVVCTRVLSGLLATALANRATDVQNTEIAECEDQDNTADREADITIGSTKVGIVAADDAVNKKRHDADEGGEEEGCKSGCKTHQQGRKPAEIAKRNAEENPIPAGAGDIMNTFHLK